MANLNKVMLIGNLTRDPEVRTFANGGKVASFGFAVNNRKKNQTTGEWENDPVFIDIKAFNRQNGRQLADQVEQFMHKGNSVYLEGKLTFEQWEKDGQKQSKLKVILDDYQLLERRPEGAGPAEGGRSYQRSATPARSQPANGSFGGNDFDEPPPEEPMQGPGPARQGSDDIPF